MIINLNYPVHKGMFKYPSDEEPDTEQIPSFFQDSRYKSARLKIQCSNHHGTHIDAPFHKLPDGKRINEYSEDKFENTCLLIDLGSRGGFRPEREITLETIKQTLEPRLATDIQALIFYTHFCDEIKEKESKLSPKEKLTFEKTFPYFSIPAIKYILEVAKRINILGIDSFAVDKEGSNSEVHRELFNRDVLPLETLVNLKELKEFVADKPFLLRSHPEKTKGADAGKTIPLAYIHYG